VENQSFNKSIVKKILSVSELYLVACYFLIFLQVFFLIRVVDECLKIGE